LISSFLFEGSLLAYRSTGFVCQIRPKNVDVDLIEKVVVLVVPVGEMIEKKISSVITTE
jgi:hypothetical protein